MRFLEKLYDSSPIFFQNLMVTVSGYDRNRSRYGKAYYDHRKFLADFDTWSLDRKRKYQLGGADNVLTAAIEETLGKKAKKNFLPMQKGDVIATWADTTDLETTFGYKPFTPVKDGIKSFWDWYLSFYNYNA
jgi:hypothetical protein